MKEMELEEIKKDKRKGRKVVVNPDSYVAKEIFYQTCLLKDLRDDILEIKGLLLKQS